MKTTFTLLLLSQVGLAMAATDSMPAEAGACGWLLTETECVEHKRVMSELRDPKSRLDYLEKHMAMLREREVMCACPTQNKLLARAQYR